MPVASAADEAGPSVTPDGLTLYFSRDPSGTDDIFVSTRPSTASPWGAPSAVTQLNTNGFLDSEPYINDTNTLILFYSARSGNNDLWMSRRSSPTQPWGAPTAISELNTTGAEGDPFLSPDEHTIYFSRDAEIYTATR